MHKKLILSTLQSPNEEEQPALCTKQSYNHARLRHDDHKIADFKKRSYTDENANIPTAFGAIHPLRKRQPL